MNTKKLDLGISIIWGISLALGFLYNSLLLPLTMNGFEYEYITKFITYFICLSGSGIFFWWFANRILKFDATKIFTLMFIPLIIAVAILHYTTGIDEIMGSTFVICVFYFFYSHCIKKYVNQKHGLKKLMGLMLLSVIAGFMVGGFSMYYITLAVMFVTSVLAGFVYNVNRSKRWYISFFLVASVLYFISPFIIVFVEHGSELLFGYLSPKDSQIYSAIVEQLTDIKLFRINILSDFASKLQYNGSSVYMHITSMFGVVAAGIIIIAQLVGVAFMIKRSKLLIDKQRRVFGVMMSLIIGMQIILSIGSSFCSLPLNDAGVPFITYKGLELSLLPLILFILNVKGDNKEPELLTDNIVPVEKEEKKRTTPLPSGVSRSG